MILSNKNTKVWCFPINFIVASYEVMPYEVNKTSTKLREHWEMTGAQFPCRWCSKAEEGRPTSVISPRLRYLPLPHRFPISGNLPPPCSCRLPRVSSCSWCSMVAAGPCLRHFSRNYPNQMPIIALSAVALSPQESPGPVSASSPGPLATLLLTSFLKFSVF